VSVSLLIVPRYSFQYLPSHLARTAKPAMIQPAKEKKIKLYETIINGYVVDPDS